MSVELSEFGSRLLVPPCDLSLRSGGDEDVVLEGGDAVDGVDDGGLRARGGSVPVVLVRETVLGDRFRGAVGFQVDVLDLNASLDRTQRKAFGTRKYRTAARGELQRRFNV